MQNCNSKLKITILLTFAFCLLIFGVAYFAHATVPVFCPEPCETWDRALSGPRNVSVGPFTIPGTGGIVSAKEGWFVCKEKECISSIVSDPIGTMVSAAKSAFSEDSIAWFLAREILHIFTQEMVSWIRTGQFGGGSLFTTDLVGELFNAADNAAGHFLAQYRSEEWYQLLCSPFRPHIYLALGSGRVPYIERARCTVTDIVSNLENFYTDFSNGGWAAWFASIEPQNNPYGLYLLSLEEKERREREGAFDIRQNFLAGGGFIGLKKCAPGAELGELHAQNPTPGKKYCTRYITVTPGKVVEDQLVDALGSDIQKLGVADELNEVIATVFDELLSWLVSGGSSGGGILGADLPDPELIEPICSIDTGRPNGCGCAAASQCATNFCSPSSICGEPTALAACNDGVDNDNDGFTDFPVDPQCVDAVDTSEREGGALSPQRLTIVSVSPLPSGAAGALYPSFTFEAEGGTPFSLSVSTFPYEWSAIDTGTHPLPAGLFLSQGGMLSGTPAAAGTWTFTAKVTDSVASSTQSTFILTVTL
jgi:hypothetical protein